MTGVAGLVGDVAMDRAKAALSVDFGQGQDEPYEAPSWRGKLFSHWSISVATGGAVVGAIACLATAILGMIPVAVASGLLLATNVISVIFLKKFVPHHSTEEITKRLADKILQGKAIIDQLHEINGERAELNETLEKQLEKVTAEHTEFVQQIEAGMKALHTETQAMEGLRDEMVDYKAPYEAMKRLALLVQKMSGEYATEREQLEKQVAQGEAKIKKVETLLTAAREQLQATDRTKGELEVQLAGVQETVAALEKARDGYRHEKHEAIKAKKALSKTLKQIETKLAQAEANAAAHQDALSKANAKIDSLQKDLDSAERDNLKRVGEISIDDDGL